MVSGVIPHKAGIPGSNRADSGDYDVFFGYDAIWWSNTQAGSSNSLSRSLHYGLAGFYQASLNTHFGFSVRCLRD